MCGIAGFVATKGINADRAVSVLRDMGATISHRGPDATAEWFDPTLNVGFVHRRLSVLDLSSAGIQPMQSSNGRYVICFNGEIYNHTSIREYVESRHGFATWKSQTDTESLLELIACEGLRPALQRAKGMFAFSLCDLKTGAVYLARDRVGEKPLYFGSQNGFHFFASELKAVAATPFFEARVNRDALCLYLRHNYVPTPFSIYEDVRKLPPGHYVELGENKPPEPYWQLDECVSPHTDLGDDAEIMARLDDTLRLAVEQQMQADVPLGAFLSGGIDSSLIVALMQESSQVPIKTFSIGFHERQFDEAPYARAIAQHLHTDHSELYVTSKEAQDVIPLLPQTYDEPFADSSQIPTYLVSKLAKSKVVVSLSGDAGDELFGGYDRYVWVEKIWKLLRWCPPAIRAPVGGILGALPRSVLDASLTPLFALMPKHRRYTDPGRKIHKLASLMSKRDPMDIYLDLVSHWDDPTALVLHGQEPANRFNEFLHEFGYLNIASKMQFVDTLTYLPDDILVKVDRAAMAHSLETRVPFLDPDVIKAAWSLPEHLKFNGGVGKWCLRELLYKRVPRSLVDRPKAGFSVPIETWLKSDLRDWAEELLSEQRLREGGYFDHKIVRDRWNSYQKDGGRWHYHLWDILMFEAWRDEYKV